MRHQERVKRRFWIALASTARFMSWIFEACSEQCEVLEIEATARASVTSNKM